MVKIAIRDDDMNYFTDVDDVENVYSPLGGVFPISFAVVPMVTDVLGDCPETAKNTIPRDIRNNPELVKWLRDNVQQGKCDILLHGLTHEYKFSKKGTKIAEMSWRSGDNQLLNELSEWKSIFEDIFKTKISVFVAPNNKISRKCIRTISLAGFNFSGIIPIKYQRGISLRNMTSYFKRWLIRLFFGIPYPNVLCYSDHREINACELGGMDYLKRIYNWCKRYNSPMIINVHYWDLRENETHRRLLYDFVSYALSDGAVPTRVSDLF